MFESANWTTLTWRQQTHHIGPLQLLALTSLCLSSDLCVSTSKVDSYFLSIQLTEAIGTKVDWFGEGVDRSLKGGGGEGEWVGDEGRVGRPSAPSSTSCVQYVGVVGVAG